MATPGERLAVLEERVDQMWEWINGGPSTLYKDSARGKLHDIMQAMSTADRLTDALQEVRKERGRQWSTWQKLLLSACAVVTALAAVYGALNG